MNRCQCGIVTGVTCSASPASTLVEYLPDELRYANPECSGAYPYNGAIRFMISHACRDEMLIWDRHWIREVSPG